MLDLQDEVGVGGLDASLGGPDATSGCAEGPCSAPASCMDDTQCAPGLRCVEQACTAPSEAVPTDTTTGSSGPAPMGDPAMPSQGTPDSGAVETPPVEEVPKTCADVSCGPNASCVTAAGGAECQCLGGFLDQDGTGTCVDKCELAGCAAMATCTITAAGEAQCACPPEYIGDGTTCEFDANCQLLNCGANTECVAQGNQRVCECLQGYEEAGGGACSDIDECGRGTAGCGRHQDCTNTPGGAECTCREDPACEKGTAVACDGDAEYRCEADADGCLTPQPSTSCYAENDCQTARCSESSGCTSTPRLVGTSCSGGVCNLVGDCVDCIADEHCGANQYCTLLGNCRATLCGDGVVSGDETCDRLLASEWECSASCDAQTLFTACASASDCINGICVSTAESTGRMCAPAAGIGAPSVSCPRVPGRTVKYVDGRYCVIECATASDCPSMLPRCVVNSRATIDPPPSNYEATRYCAPQ